MAVPMCNSVGGKFRRGRGAEEFLDIGVNTIDQGTEDWPDGSVHHIAQDLVNSGHVHSGHQGQIHPGKHLFYHSAGSNFLYIFLAGLLPKIIGRWVK